MKLLRLSLKTTFMICCMTVLFNACRTIPLGVVAEKSFEKEKYLGKWYEIARFDFRFERNLNNTTAHYSLNSDGTIKVVNRGYNYVTHEWKESVGKAKFVGDTTEAKLKVSFFGPFYSGYNVIAIDPDYQYALVSGKSMKYLWILAREKTIPETVKSKYVEIARYYGYPVEDLIWVQQD